MFRLSACVCVLALSLAAVCQAQEEVERSESTVESADALAELQARISDLESAAESQDDQSALKIVFILLMFTNAIVCGLWALSSERNFWGWYLAGLFTGPLAGGVMLERCSRDCNEGKPQVGCWAALAGIGIPFAGWIIWMGILG